jgi:hypothetical protein
MGELSDAHEKELKRFNDNLRDLEKGCTHITRAQFEKLYSERARAIQNDILRDFAKARLDFLKNNSDVTKGELEAALSEHYEAIAPDIMNDEHLSSFRDFMSIIPADALRNLVDKYRSRNTR